MDTGGLAVQISLPYKFYIYDCILENDVPISMM